MSNDLSEDLILEICSWLPSESLLRFRSVSKSLRACIDSPGFTRLLALRSRKKLLIVHANGDVCKVYTLHKEDKHYNILSGVTPSEYPLARIKIVGSCNGVLCLYKREKDGFTLWNPSIRRKLSVPGKEVSYRLVDGFGFDPITNDYKIIRISRQGSFVYTLKARDWRMIPSPTTPFPNTFFSDINSYECLFNGVLHWVANLRNSSNKRYYSYIMTFDFSSEVFSTIELPEPSWGTSVVTIINGCLGVVSSNGEHSSLIWVMKEYGNPGSWYIAYENQLKSFKSAKRVFQSDVNGYLMFKNSKGIKVCNPKAPYQVLPEFQKLNRSSHIKDMNVCVESLGLLDMGISCDKGSKTLGKKSEKQYK